MASNLWERVKEAIRDLADELESEVEFRYAATKDHPAMRWRYERDMEPVVEARALLAEMGSRIVSDDYPRVKPDGWIYVAGACRNAPNATRTHVYTGPSYSDLVGPLCGYGWNRSDGEGFSILRNNESSRATCRTCEKRMDAGRGPVAPWHHKTRWI